jgi:adenylate kinase
MMNNPQTFMFFGTVGSGKGTQAELLKNYLIDKKISSDVVYVCTGVEYRKLIESGNYTGTIAKTSIEKGELQPDFLTSGLFTNALVSSMKENSALIADGFPRTILQSEVFEKAMDFYARNDIHIIYIELDKEEASKRMMFRGRADDTPEGIARRFDEYANNVIPSMNYFKDKPGYEIHVIDGKQSIEKVHGDIIKSLII